MALSERMRDPRWRQRDIYRNRPRRPPKPKPGRMSGMSERERDPAWDEPGRDVYPNSPAGPSTDTYTGPPGLGNSQDPLIDFDALLASDPRVIASKAALDENVGAAKLAREAAIKRAAIALGLSQDEIARQSGFRTADTGAGLAGRGMLLRGTGAYGGALTRIEDARQRDLAAANQRQIDTVNAALSTEADLIRQFNQSYQESLAEAAYALSQDPRYQVPKSSGSGSEPKTPKPSAPPKGESSGGKKPQDRVPMDGGRDRPLRKKGKKKPPRKTGGV